MQKKTYPQHKNTTSKFAISHSASSLPSPPFICSNLPDCQGRRPGHWGKWVCVDGHIYQSPFIDNHWDVGYVNGYFEVEYPPESLFPDYDTKFSSYKVRLLRVMMPSSRVTRCVYYVFVGVLLFCRKCNGCHLMDLPCVPVFFVLDYF